MVALARFPTWAARPRADKHSAPEVPIEDVMSPSWMRDNIILCTMRHVWLWRSMALGAAYQGSLNPRPIMNRGLMLCIFSDRGCAVLIVPLASQWTQETESPTLSVYRAVFFLMRSCWTRPYRLPMKLLSKHATASPWRNCATRHACCFILLFPGGELWAAWWPGHWYWQEPTLLLPGALLAFLSGRGIWTYLPIHH